MVDYQFLGIVAVVLAVATRASILPVLGFTALTAAVMLAYETVARRYRRRHDASTAGPAAPDPTDSDLTRWMSVMDRVLRSDD